MSFRTFLALITRCSPRNFRIDQLRHVEKQIDPLGPLAGLSALAVITLIRETVTL